MVCLGYICINTLHKGDNDEYYNNNNNNNNNNSYANKLNFVLRFNFKNRKDIPSVRLITIVLLQFLAL